MTKPANPRHIVPCYVLCYVYLKSQDNGYSTMKVADSMWCWAVGRARDLTMLPRLVLTIVTTLIHIQNMEQQKQYTEIIVQASPNWYVTFEPHRPIKAPILDFVLIFRLSNGQEQLDVEFWKVMVLEFLMVPPMHRLQASPFLFLSNHALFPSYLSWQRPERRKFEYKVTTESIPQQLPHPRSEQRKFAPYTT